MKEIRYASVCHREQAAGGSLNKGRMYSSLWSCIAILIIAKAVDCVIVMSTLVLFEGLETNRSRVVPRGIDTFAPAVAKHCTAKVF